jgi:hypothetical protein
MIVAHSCGHLCPRQSFDGQVHSVFARSVNIITGLMQTPWVSVLDASLPATPTGFQCDMSATGNLSTKLRAGDGAFMRGGVIRFKPARLLQVITISALDWCRAPAISKLNTQRLHNKLQRAERTLFTQISNRTGRPVLSVNDYLQHAGLTAPQRLGAYPESLFDNLGKGEGLTPAGDDFVLGALAVACALRPVWPQAQEVFQRLNGPGLFNAYQTTDISAHYLQLALDGHFSQPVQWLVYHLLHSGDDAQLQQALAATLQVGASSGADTCAGIVYAMHQLLPH